MYFENIDAQFLSNIVTLHMQAYFAANIMTVHASMITA